MDTGDLDKYNGRLQELNSEEKRLEQYLIQNSNSLELNEIERIRNQIVSVRSEKEEIVQVITGGFY